MSTFDYQTIYQRCRKRLIALAARSLPCDQDAEDVFGEAFSRFFVRDLSDCSDREAEFYLIRCVLNAITDFWRCVKKRNEEEYEKCSHLSGSEPNPWERLMYSEDHRWLRQAVSRLPLRQRQAIWLRYFGEHSLDEIAEIMECDPSTVRSLIHNAIQRLKEEYRDATTERSHES